MCSAKFTGSIRTTTTASVVCQLNTKQTWEHDHLFLCLLTFFNVISQGGLLAGGNRPEERRFSRLWNQNKQSPAPATQQPTAADRGYLCSHTWAITTVSTEQLYRPLQLREHKKNRLPRRKCTQHAVSLILKLKLKFSCCVRKCKL